jgi:hypothetical protein
LPRGYVALVFVSVGVGFAGRAAALVAVALGEKTGAQNIVKEIKQYQKKWLQHVQRMDRNILPRQALKYRPEGRQNIGRPKKRWRDQLHFED